MKSSFQIIIIGGGNAGLSVASQLLIKDKSLDIAIVDPAEKHYYQPAWTLVGGGTFDISKTVRAEKDVIPNGTTWIQKGVVSFQPEENKITLQDGTKLGFVPITVSKPHHIPLKQ